MEVPVVILIGRSGCGKGTQANLLLDYWREHQPRQPLLYLQTGKHFRDFAATQNYTAVLARNCMEAGVRLPDFLAVWNWSRIVVERFTGRERLVFDGAPRSLDEARALDYAFSFYNLRPAVIIYLNVSRTWSAERLRARGRDDDSRKDNIDRRLDWYEVEVAPAVEYFRAAPGYRFFDVDGERPIEEIHWDIVSRLEK